MRTIVQYVELIGLIMEAAKEDGHQLEELITRVCAIHLMSSSADPIHMNGIVFAQKLEVVLLAHPPMINNSN